LGDDNQSTRIEAINIDDLMVKLRGFSFSLDEQIPVHFITAARRSNESFTPRLSRQKDETLRVGERVVDAFKLELEFSAPRLWNTLRLVPRTFFWYSVDAPHVLLRAETTEVPGSPRWLLEAIEYSEW
jgi:hypothetical protein